MTTLPAHASSFMYRAITPTGGRTMGVRQAASARALAEQLRKERLLLLWSCRLPIGLARKPGLTLKDRQNLNEQLAQLLSRGVPLVEALEVTGSVVGPRARPTVQRLREHVSSGSSFSDACAKVGGFDRVTVAVYQAAERTGDLATASKQLAINARRQLAIAGKALTLLTYPAVVLSISVLVAVMMLTVIVPQIGAALSGLDIKLPWYTNAVIGLGNGLRTYAVLVLLGLGLAVIGGIIWRRAVARWAAVAFRTLPLIREVILAQETARFFAIMAAMSRSGVPLADSLAVANDALKHVRLKKEIGTLRSRLIEGGLFRTLVEAISSFPLATRRLLVAGERAGDLDTVFDTLSNDLADDVDRKTDRLLSVLEPVLIIGMFLVIATLMLAIMVPLITLSNQAG